VGWGCYKHEWDAGSEAWREHLSELCERMLEAPGDLTWGRDLEVCPKCWVELEMAWRRQNAAVGALNKELGRDMGTVPDAAYLKAELEEVRSEGRSLRRRLKQETERSEWGIKLAELIGSRGHCPGCGASGDPWAHRRCCQVARLAGAIEGQTLAEHLMRAGEGR